MLQYYAARNNFNNKGLFWSYAKLSNLYLVYIQQYCSCSLNIEMRRVVVVVVEEHIHFPVIGQRQTLTIDERFSCFSLK